MINYRFRDYVFNKKSDGIVYRSCDGTTVTITKDDYLAENPGLTEADFLELKKFSDEIYEEEDLAESRQTRQNVSMDALGDSVQCASKSAEDVYFDTFDKEEEAELHSQKLETAEKALDILSDAQRRRYLMYHVDRLTVREIAKTEGISHVAVVDCLDKADKRIKNWFKNA